jgi:tRNA modification GTPase
VTFLDMAGLRESEDRLEQMGVARARERAAAADLRILLQDGTMEGDDFDPGLDIDLSYRTKADLTGQGVSALTGQGVDRILEDVAKGLSERVSGIAIASHERHRQAMRSAREALLLADKAFCNRDGAEIIAYHLRDALASLDSLIGRVDVEAVLGEIFAQICIGK